MKGLLRYLSRILCVAIATIGVLSLLLGMPAIAQNSAPSDPPSSRTSEAASSPTETDTETEANRPRQTVRANRGRDRTPPHVYNFRAMKKYNTQTYREDTVGPYRADEEE
ncbi:hypothetical protein [Synechococcus sp. PCC 7336]|uniref:hypothetical protein n=1 Tax=Synechococcus sp. PCC 7336 TaxID=195250 RepID=UPI0012EAB0AD|nr:hypothetical protein [Synechococcus sp. PCC 7336]